MIIRKLKSDEIPVLEDAMYNAIFIPPGAEKLPRSILQVPEIKRYYHEFGRNGDLCLVADFEGCIVGTIWIRLFTKTEPGYGFINEATPELAMSVKEEYRKQGIGQKLLDNMLQELEKRGYKQVSLSVDKNVNTNR